MAVSLWRLWERAREGTADASYAIGLFLAQLALNAAWSPIFFGFHAIRGGLAVIVGIAIALTATIIVAFRVDRLAPWLLALSGLDPLRRFT
jgi:tryptophan-rich sensory protein